MVGVTRLAVVMAICGFLLGGAMGWSMTESREGNRSGAGIHAAALQRQAEALYEAGERGVEYERTVRAARQAEAVASSEQRSSWDQDLWTMAVCAGLGAALCGGAAFVLGGLGLWVLRGFQAGA